MARIAVIGGTGYAGGHIVKEAAARGHTVVSIARKVAPERVAGVTYLEGSILDVPDLVAELQGVDVVVVAVAARGDMVGKLRDATAELVASLPETVRVGVVGGSGGSLVAAGGPTVVETGYPEEFRAEAETGVAVLTDLETVPLPRDWFLIHPAAEFGAWNPGERTGAYRDGGDVQVTDAEGRSYISGEDLAVAVLDEIEQPKHRRGRFSVGY